MSNRDALEQAMAASATPRRPAMVRITEAEPAIQRRVTAVRRRLGTRAVSGGARPLSSAVRRVPLAGWICALVAIVNAASWSVISPPFQLPDEPSHFAYVQHLEQTGHLPSSDGEKYPPAEEIALTYLLHSQVKFSQENQPIASRAEQRSLESVLALPLSRAEPGGAGVAASEPPLYYALETLPYALGSGGTLLDSLAWMRLFSALYAGLTALFAFLFLREALPAARWAWTVGGLGVALTPVLGMMSGAVNPDALLFAVSSALFYFLARAFRRGLTRGLATAIAATIAIGCLTKLLFLGLVPGAALALLLLTIRQARVSGRAAYRSLVLALAIAAVPICLYALVDVLSSRTTLKVLSAEETFAGPRHKSILGALVYVWQLYLPRLPGMRPTFHGISGAQVWFEQVVGKYGWLDTTFPPWVIKVAFIPAVLLTLLFIRALVTNAHSLRARGVELAAYGLMGLGVLGLIGTDEYLNQIPGEYIQLRYVMPLLALLGATLALAARGAGRRWGPVAGALIVLLVLAHDLFSQLLVVSRYYG